MIGFKVFVLIHLAHIRDFHFTFESRIKSIFNVIVSPARQELCNFRPFISKLLVKSDNGYVLLRSPFILLNVRVQVIVPPFATLLSYSPWESLCNVAPILSTVFCNIFREFLILFLAPGSFNHRRIEHFLPPMKTLDISPLVEV